MSQKIVPNIWFDRNTDQAGAFYAEALPRTTAKVAAAYPDDVADGQASFAGQTLVVDLDVDGYHLSLINAGPEFRPNPSVSFLLNFDPLAFESEDDAGAQLDATWTRLAEAGRVIRDLGASPFSPLYGWVQDRYGVSWQVLLATGEGEPRPFVIPQLMFSGSVQNRAREAAEYYTSLFPDARLGHVAEYQQETGPASADSIAFGEFRIAGQWFSMMDSGVEQDVPFTCGVSLEVSVDAQEELDRYWNALSAVPEAEQCGWLADRYGLSWQIVPANMGALMARPGAYEKMMAMKKLIIADF